MERKIKKIITPPPPHEQIKQKKTTNNHKKTKSGYHRPKLPPYWLTCSEAGRGDGFVATAAAAEDTLLAEAGDTLPAGLLSLSPAGAAAGVEATEPGFGRPDGLGDTLDFFSPSGVLSLLRDTREVLEAGASPPAGKPSRLSVPG